ncbi:MAG TPA: hypothetical protein ENJ08_08490 [Gammaproteobacteria bacterium]|nr:hypothetical protein [Gammaproteobacteria bacterium]
MAKTDFSSSSPLAGSFLTGHIYLPPLRPALILHWPVVAILYFLFFAVEQSLLCERFTRAGVVCGFCAGMIMG